MRNSVKKKVHRNIPQLLFLAIWAKITYLIWGRATGKTRGVVSDFVLENVLSMPRSSGAIFCNSYTDIMVKILPALVAGWEERGFRENEHYFIGRYAPPSYKWRMPLRKPRDARYLVHWFNGSIFNLVSGDHSITNGTDYDYGVIEEYRYQNPQKVDEFVKTIRGNGHVFGHLSNHGSMLYVTDMPRSPKERYILEKRAEMDEELITLILESNAVLQNIRADLEKPGTNKNILHLQAQQIERNLHALRKNAVYFSTASTFDNVHAVGIDTLESWARQMSELDFRISVCNEEISKLEGGFYALLDENKHGGWYDDVMYIDSLGLQYNVAGITSVHRDCLWDMDRVDDLPLDLSFDCNNAINCCTVGQAVGNERRYLNFLFVLKPQYLKDCARRFCKYYAKHKCREINLVFDHTHTAGNARGDADYRQDWVDILEAEGWIVHQHPLGQSPQHHTRYNEWQQVLAEDPANNVPFVVKFNRGNCADLLLGMTAAPVIQDRDMFKKDKRSEKDNHTPPQHATHGSEAADMLMHWWYDTAMNGTATFMGTHFPNAS